MKRLFTLFILLLIVFAVHAQNLSVESFRMDIKDLTANTAGTTVLDQNGEKCALIKVETTQTGFAFNTGSLGVMKTEQHVGEIWVYVPEGVKRITISHQQLGTYSKVDRDPRGRTITIAYLAIINEPVSVTGQDDAAKAEWWPLSVLPQLAFDHYEIMQDAIRLYHQIENPLLQSTM